MARRTADNDQSFGSDAFLDVIANIVGILIILIVVAGVKVSRAPRPLQPEANLSVTEAEVADLVLPMFDLTADSLLAELGDSADWPARYLPPPRSETLPVESVEVTPPVPAPVRPVPVVAPPQDLVDRARQLSDWIAAVEARVEEAHAHYVQLEHQHRGLHASVVDQESLLAARQSALALETLRVDQLDSTLHETAQQLAQLQREVDLVLQQEPEVQVLEHRLNPISRSVTRREVHFRLSEGRVSHVPINELAAQVQQDILRQRDLLLKLRYYDGSVGPIEGYRMRYVVQQQDMSLLDELRQGGNLIRVGITQWLLIPEPDLEGETAEAALRNGSRFLRVLRTSPGAVLTFWVYPDSFDTHQTLNAYVREAGFDVAARPLPVGVPIAGSPHGSRSVAQ